MEEIVLDVVQRITNNPHTRHRAAPAPRYSVTLSQRFTIMIPADHPSLPGHFPGRPIVPGAVMLAEIVHAVTPALGDGARVTGFPFVKFSTPMLPGQRCELTLSDRGVGAATFELTQETRRVASGNLRYERASAAS